MFIATVVYSPGYDKAIAFAGRALSPLLQLLLTNSIKQRVPAMQYFFKQNAEIYRPPNYMLRAYVTIELDI